jgi:hypothetical protein
LPASFAAQVQNILIYRLNPSAIRPDTAYQAIFMPVAVVFL